MFLLMMIIVGLMMLVVDELGILLEVREKKKRGEEAVEVKGHLSDLRTKMVMRF